MKKTRRLVLLVMALPPYLPLDRLHNAKYRKKLIPTPRFSTVARGSHAISGNLDLFSASYTVDGESEDFRRTNPYWKLIAIIRTGASSTVVDFAGSNLDTVAYKINFVDITPGTDGISPYNHCVLNATTTGVTPGDQTLTEALKAKLLILKLLEGATINGNLSTLETDLKTWTAPKTGQSPRAEWPTKSMLLEWRTRWRNRRFDDAGLRLKVKLAYRRSSRLNLAREQTKNHHKMRPLGLILIGNIYDCAAEAWCLPLFLGLGSAIVVMGAWRQRLKWTISSSCTCHRPLIKRRHRRITARYPVTHW